MQNPEPRALNPRITDVSEILQDKSRVIYDLARIYFHRNDHTLKSTFASRYALRAPLRGIRSNRAPNAGTRRKRIYRKDVTLPQWIWALGQLLGYEPFSKRSKAHLHLTEHPNASGAIGWSNWGHVYALFISLLTPGRAGVRSRPVWSTAQNRTTRSPGTTNGWPRPSRIE